jgi:hypothetical protein
MTEHKLLDATGAVLFARQLEHVKSQTYDVKYGDLDYRMLFPVNSDVNPAATSITYRTFDKVGKANIINAYGADLPRADVAGKETNHPVRTLASSFGYSVKEIMAAQMGNFQLDTKRAEAARRAIEETMNDVVFNGDAQSNLPGLFSNSDIPAGNVPNGAAATPQWSTKTPDEIIFDVTTACSTQYESTLKKESPTRLVLPIAQWNYIHSTPRATGSDQNIAQWILANSPFIKEIVASNEMNAAGAGGGDVFMIYNPDPSKLQIEIPEDIKFWPEQQTNLEYVVPVTAEFASLHVYYPLSVRIMEDI